jgi:predicted deacetylase
MEAPRNGMTITQQQAMIHPSWQADFVRIATRWQPHIAFAHHNHAAVKYLHKETLSARHTRKTLLTFYDFKLPHYRRSRPAQPLQGP